MTAVSPQCEHVRDHFSRYALAFELLGQREKHFVRQVGERRTNSRGGRELREQHGRLANDRVGEKLDVHASSSKCGASERGDPSTIVAEVSVLRAAQPTPTGVTQTPPQPRRNRSRADLRHRPIQPHPRPHAPANAAP
jgi:hypothetical protein